MTRGKKVCKILKEIRQQIAEKNDVEYITSECHFQGECQGTCPKCEAEVRYLENELNRRRQLGKAVAIAGISLGIASAFSACSSSKQNLLQQDNNVLIPERRLAGVIRQPDIVDTVPFQEEIESDEDISFRGKVHEEMPEYQGGMQELYKFLLNNLKYPESTRNLPSGTVVVSFYIEKDGSISDIELVKDIGYGFGEEVMRIVKMMPKWKPAQINGENIRRQYILPVRFRLK